MTITRNSGEWAELYALLDILSEGVFLRVIIPLNQLL